MQIKEASKKWNISERRIRQLIKDGRVENAIKIGNTWNIPDDTNKPIDKRIKEKNDFIINIDKDYFKEIDKKLEILIKSLKLLNPLSILEKGYSVITKDDKVINNKDNLNKNDIIDIKLYKGNIKAKVMEVK